MGPPSGLSLRVMGRGMPRKSLRLTWLVGMLEQGIAGGSDGVGLEESAARPRSLGISRDPRRLLAPCKPRNRSTSTVLAISWRMTRRGYAPISASLSPSKTQCKIRGRSPTSTHTRNTRPRFTGTAA